MKMKKETKGKKAINIESQFDKLVALGRKKGHLTYEEINDFLPEEVVSSEQIEKVLVILEKENIEVVDSENEAKLANKEEDAGDGKQIFDTERRTVSESAEAREVVDIGIEDPVKMYLRQMGQIPLLSRQDEIRLAQEIEKAEEDYKRSILSSPFIKDEVLALANRILSKNINMEEVIKEDPKIKTEILIFKKITNLVRRIRAARKGSNIMDICLEFNFCISIIDDMSSGIKAAISELFFLKISSNSLAHANSQLGNFFQSSHLHWRSMGTQQPTIIWRTPFNIERILYISRRMPGRNIQSFKIVILAFQLRPVQHHKTHGTEQDFQFSLHLPHGVHVPLHWLYSRNSDVNW